MIGQGIQAFQEGNIEGAESILKRVLQIYPSSYPALQIMGLINASQNNPKQAIIYFEKALKINSQDPTLLYNLGQALEVSNKHREALAHFEKYTRLAPSDLRGWISYARCLLSLGRYQDAISAIDHLLAQDPKNIQLLMLKGLGFKGLREFESATEVYKHILKLDENFLDALLDLGSAYEGLGRYEEALAAIQKAIEIAPQDPRVWYERGTYLAGLARYQDSLPNFEMAASLAPGYVEAWVNKGAALKELRLYREAFKAFEAALEIDPNNRMTLLNLGAMFREMKNNELALEVNERLLAIDLNYSEGWFIKGILLSNLDRYEEAIPALKRARDLGVGNLSANMLILNFSKRAIADWNEYESIEKFIYDDLTNNPGFVEPFSTLSMFDEPILIKGVASRFTNKTVKGVAVDISVKDYGHSKIRLGYFSSDFKEHPVGRLMIDVITQHNRDLFDVYGFSLTPVKSNDLLRNKFQEKFDHFEDCESLSNDEIVRKALEYEIDIAIDLNGHTDGNRIEAFANRIAPVQVNFLGYPGTMGADFIDYIIADEVVIPSESTQFYCEKIAYLPRSYLPYDSTQLSLSSLPLKADVGLPSSGVIFCGFNNSYKISKNILKIWAKILRSVDGSVIWLLDINAAFKVNILKEFAKLDISADRVVFAPRVQAVEDHLARIACADIFLDTWPFNAHSTAMDILCAGVPVVTKIGNAFQARVGASLLTTLGMKELIADTPEEYERIAIALAKDPIKLEALKKNLRSNEVREKLFDTQKYTRNLEDLYKQMFEIYRNNLPVDHLRAKV